MTFEPIYVVGLGASTPVGRNAWSSAAAVRAGISGFTRHPYMIDSAGEPMVVALAPWVDIAVTGVQRLQALLFPAIDQVLQLRAGRAPQLRTALALALPEERPGLPADYSAQLLGSIQSEYADVFTATAVFPNGHAAGLLALQIVIRKLAQGDFDACVLAGVDSYLSPQTLEWLEACDQLHGAGPLNNAWGFVPGEGAGALLLVRNAVADQFHDVLLAQVLGVGTATESNRIKTQTVCIGAGLTRAFQAALQPMAQAEPVSDIYCDLNGEPYRADEYGFTCLRTKEYFKSASDFVAPADCWGDVSAAGTPLHIALAAIAGDKGYANDSTALVWASSEGGARGAAVFRVRRGDANAG
jgi:3-oxoacyl-[acyl-carrier-protein] synthase-1